MKPQHQAADITQKGKKNTINNFCHILSSATWLPESESDTHALVLDSSGIWHVLFFFG